MITLDLSILNQKGTPMFNSDTLANRPAAGIVGRIFIAIDAPYGIYRDTGSAWDQISGASTFSGSLATGQVAFGSATNTISGTNNLFWDAANARVGIGTNSPSSTLDIRGKARLQASGNCEFDFIDGSQALRIGVNPTSGFLQTITSIPLGFFTGALKRGEFSTNGNFILQSGGTFADTGQKLQVIGDTFLKGTGTTSATNALLIANSAGTQQFILNNAGNAMFGLNVPSGGNVKLETDAVVRAWTSIELGQFGTATFNTTSLTKGASGSDFYEFVNGASHTATQGTYYFFQLRNSVTSTSGTAIINGLNLNFTINQTGGANGITRGLYVNPTLTSAADWRSIEWSNNTGFGLYGAGTALNYLGGTLGIKTTSPYAPSTFSLDVNGGLLVKNTAGTTAQITLINADPSIGGNNGFLVASVGGTSGGSFVDFQGYYGASITGSTALRLNPAGGAVIVNSTTNTGEQFQLTGTLRINGQSSGTSGGNSGQHLIINLDGTTYKIRLELP